MVSLLCVSVPQFTRGRETRNDQKETIVRETRILWRRERRTGREKGMKARQEGEKERKINREREEANDVL